MEDVVVWLGPGTEARPTHLQAARQPLAELASPDGSFYCFTSMLTNLK